MVTGSVIRGNAHCMIPKPHPFPRRTRSTEYDARTPHATGLTIDVHVHLVGISPANDCFLGWRGMHRAFRGFQRRVLRTFGMSRSTFDRRWRRKLLRLVTESGLHYAGLLALDGVYDRNGLLDRKATSLYVSNDYLFKVVADSPKYLPIPSVNPARRDALEELDRVSDLGAVAIKVLPNAQNFDPADERFLPFWRRMKELGLPLLAHTGIEFTLPQHRVAFGEPDRLRPALDEGLTVIAAHCGTAGGRRLTGHLHQWLGMLEEYPNLYGDLSAMVSPARLPFASRILEHPLARERVLLGSDYPVPITPLLLPRKLGPARAVRIQRIRNPLQRNLEALRALGMPEEAEARAWRILRITPHQQASSAD
jgi:uncharacterized protein